MWGIEEVPIQNARVSRGVAALACFSALICGGCREGTGRVEAAPAPQTQAAGVARAEVSRITGVVQALESFLLRVPQISGQNSRVTLARLIPNGSRVKKDDVVAEFDQTTFRDQEREALAKLDDLTHQLEQKRAQNRSDAENRESQLGEAEADLQKARIELKKGPILSEIDRLKNEERERSAVARVASLKKSGGHRREAEGAAARVLELKVERQRVALERIRNNMERLVLKAPGDGMVALENTWRNGSMGPPQEGDQLWPGQPVVRVFNPTRMVVDALVNEPDFAVMAAGARAKVYLDAYPGAAFDAELDAASPVATPGLDSPVRTFSARFRLGQIDPRLLPDLSASLEVRVR